MHCYTLVRVLVLLTLLPTQIVSDVIDRSLLKGLCAAGLIKFHARDVQGATSSSNQGDDHPHSAFNSMVTKWMHARCPGKPSQSQRLTCLHIIEK